MKKKQEDDLSYQLNLEKWRRQVKIGDMVKLTSKFRKNLVGVVIGYSTLESIVVKVESDDRMNGTQLTLYYPQELKNITGLRKANEVEK